MSTLVRAAKAIEMTQGDILIEKIETLEIDAQCIKRELKDKDYQIGALKAIRESLRILELLARLKGEIESTQKINIFLSPEWTRPQSLILSSMEPCPEAKQKLLLALESKNGYS